MTTPTSTPGSNIEVDLRATNPRTDFDVSEDYVLEAREGAIPDSVESRQDDTETATFSGSSGLVIKPNDDFGSFGARVSNKTSGVSRARLYDYSQSAYVATVDISGLSAGDAFTFDFQITSGTEYGIELDNSGGDYTQGFYQTVEYDYPYTGSDIDIVGRSDGGSKTTTANPCTVNDIGDVGF